MSRWRATTRPGVDDEQGQHVEFLGREVELDVVLPRAVRFGIDQHALDAGRLARRREPQAHAYPGEQLGEPERLGDVVVGAGVEPDHDVGLLAAGREHDDREPLVPGPERPAHGEAVEVGEGQVEQHEVDAAARGLERGVALHDVLHLEALPFEGPQQRLRDREVVFDEQDRGHRARAYDQMRDRHGTWSDGTSRRPVPGAEHDR